MVPQEFSKWSVVSIVFFLLAFAFGTGCIVGTYQAEWLREDLNAQGDMDMSDNEEYTTDRNVAIGAGAGATLCFTLATFCSFYAGMRHKSKGTGKGKLKTVAPAVVAWVTFALVFILNLIILIVAFDDDTKPIWIEAVWVAFIGNILAFVFMFGYSQVARTTYKVPKPGKK